LVLGYDHTDSSGSNVETWVAEPSLRWHYKAGERLTLVWGVEGSFHDYVQGAPSSTIGGNNFSLSTFTQDLRALYQGSALAEVLWRPTSRWLIRPGVRADVYYDKTTTKSGADPRLTMRYKLTARELAGVPADSDDSAVWLKAAVGMYHQPPRFVLPLPGLDTMPLKYGLQQSIQTSLGAEIPLSQHFSATVEGYFAYMDPTIFDLTVNSQDLNTAGQTTLIGSGAPGQTTAQDVLNRLVEPHTGRAYGLETLIRRQAKSGLYGWLSYTLSRSERYRNGAWAPYDFDRTHLVNLVGGLRLPRNWDVGVRLQYQSGKPATTTYGYNTARTNGYDRVDIRVDKRAVYRGWLLDFYVDIMNAALLPEEVTPGVNIRYVLPTLGLRARF
jgi:hypothetical protein